MKGANLAMEQIDADLHGWPMTTWESKRATMRTTCEFDWALTPEHTENITLGIAGHNLLCYGCRELANIRVADAIDFEMLVGMADAQAQAIRDEVGTSSSTFPWLTQPSSMAIAYPVRRLEEGVLTRTSWPQSLT